MPEFIANASWSVILPILAMSAFAVGLVVKAMQDKTVEVVRNLTIKPGEVNVSDLQAYARAREV